MSAARRGGIFADDGRPPFGTVRYDATGQVIVGPTSANTTSNAGVSNRAIEHERAMVKAQLIDRTTAGDQLVEQIKRARLRAGKPSLDNIAKAIDYSAPTVSKVLNGRMHPTWKMVRRLGRHLEVPPVVVNGEWHPLWMAAEWHRDAQKTENRATKTAKAKEQAETAAVVSALAAAAAAGSALPSGVDPSSGPPAGEMCGRCGTLALDVVLHTKWHLAVEPDVHAASMPEALTTFAEADAWESMKETLHGVLEDRTDT